MSATNGTAAKVVFEDVVKRFDSAGEAVEALAGVTGSVANGEFLSILGPSGCGKSTLLNIIAGLDDPTSGRILVDGEELKNRRRQFGYMFQKDLLFPWRTIEENVALGMEVEKGDRKAAEEQARVLLDRFGLGRFKKHYPAQLSGGMRQRVALMRTLLCDRDALLLDEPFGALDALTRTVMREWLLDIWMSDRRTVIFITHDIEEAIFLSDRVLVMGARPGRIKAEFPIDFPRPRDAELVATPEFAELKHRMLSLIHEETVQIAEGV